MRFTTSEFDTEIRINGSGVRDDEEIGPKPPDERRIVLLGDSLVLSVQVPFSQTFGELLERRLNADRVAVPLSGDQRRRAGIRAGRGAAFFESMAATLQPDLVIETIFVGNDAEEAVAHRVAAEGRRSGRHRSPSETLWRPDSGGSSGAAWCCNCCGCASSLPPRGFMDCSPRQSRRSRATRRARRRESPRDLPSPGNASETLRRSPRRQGASTAIVLMPARFQVDDADYGRLKEAVTAAGGELLRDAATQRFDAALAELPLPRFDLLPALRARTAGPGLFFQQTVHLTPRGHEIVAEALERFIEEQHLGTPAPARPSR